MTHHKAKVMHIIPKVNKTHDYYNNTDGLQKHVYIYTKCDMYYTKCVSQEITCMCVIMTHCFVLSALWVMLVTQ